MKYLIAITSCARDRAAQQAQRDTWIKDIPEASAKFGKKINVGPQYLSVDYRFFLGQPKPADARDDEVFLNVPDDYDSLAHKTKGLFVWAYENGYNHTFKTDVDTLVCPVALLDSGFNSCDYMGGLHHGSDGMMFASGGSGYWLSSKVYPFVNASTPQNGEAEDLFIAKLCYANEITLHGNPMYKFKPGVKLTKDTVSYHLSSAHGFGGGYYPELMYDSYQWYKEKCC